MRLTEFFREAAKLKEVRRSGWISKLAVSDGESVADHSYSVAVIGMVLSDVAGLDSNKVIKMSLLHDLAESRIGDLVPGEILGDEKARIEDEAFADIISTLPARLQSEYHAIWNEYCASDTPEAILVHQVDRLEMALQASTYAENGRTERGIEEFIESAYTVITDPIAKEIITDLVQGNKSRTQGRSVGTTAFCSDRPCQYS